jgi:hypothetical protein
VAKNEIKVAVVVDPSGAKSGVKTVQGEFAKLGAAAEGTGSKLSGNLGTAFSDLTGKGGKAVGTLSTLSGGLGGMSVPLLAAGAGIAKFALDGAAKFGDLGVAVDKFSTVSGVGNEAASKWIAVADDYGISAETLSGAVGKLGKTLGNNVNALEQYGVSAVKAKDGTVDLSATTLKTIDAYNATVDPAKKAALGAAAFGKSYQELIPLIEKGSASITSSFDKVSAAQTFDDGGKKVGAAKAYKAAMDDLHDSVTDLQMTLGQKLIPTLTDLASVASKASSVMVWMGDHVPTQVFSTLEGYLNPVVAGFKTVTKANDDLEKSFLHDEGRTSFDKWAIKHSGFLPSLAGGVDVVVDSVAVMGRTSTTAAQNLETLYMAQLDLKGSSEKMTKALDANAGSSKDVVTAYKEQQDALKNLQDAQAGTTDAALASQQADLSAADAIDNYTASLKVNHDKVKDNDQTQRQLQQTFIDTQKSIFDTAGTYGDYVVAQEKGAGRIVTATQETTVRNQAQIDKLGELQATVAPGSPLWDAIQQYIDHLKAIPTSVYTNVESNISGNAAGQKLKGGFAEGGLVPGPTGAPLVAIVHGGEYVIPNSVMSAARMPLGMPTGDTPAVRVAPPPLAQSRVTAPASRVAIPQQTPVSDQNSAVGDHWIFNGHTWVWSSGDQTYATPWESPAYASSLYNTPSSPSSKSLAASRATDGGGSTYTIINNVAAGADPVAVGRVTVEAIKAYERTSGTGWRS